MEHVESSLSQSSTSPSLCPLPLPLSVPFPSPFCNIGSGTVWVIPSLVFVYGSLPIIGASNSVGFPSMEASPL